jgi:hypothetical protein
MTRRILLFLTAAWNFDSVWAFSSHKPSTFGSTELQAHGKNDPGVSAEIHRDAMTRREAIAIGLATVSSVPVATGAEEFSPSKRPFAYRVDSTIPPTLLPLSATQELAVLKGLGRGSGTSKAGVTEDRLNLNNMAYKGVFGTIGAVQSALGLNPDEMKKSGQGYATFVAMGVPKMTSSEDINLAQNLLSHIIEGRKSKNASTGLALYFVPLSAQKALTAFQTSGDMGKLTTALLNAGVQDSTVDLYKPLFDFARTYNLDLVAMSPELEDIRTVRTQGLQSVSADRRLQYVADPQGFVALTQDPKFRLYADRSLLKDFEPTSKADLAGDFFAERILVHETGATALAKYSTARPESLVAFVAPIADVRFLGGYNGRLSRISQFIQQDENKVNDDCITTILVNPSAQETLSLSRYLRLEIGTAPDNLEYQSKVSDYLWFSRMPKVNMLPRLMNG